MQFNRKFHAVLLFLVLGLMFSLVYNIHLTYRYPLHVDEWQHISKAVQITYDEKVSFTDPHFIKSSVKVTHEEGFAVILAVLFDLAGLDIVLYYKFLPALSAILTSLTLYILVKRLTSPTVALTSLFFLASIKSNVNILGFFFYTPLSATFSLMFLTALATVNCITRDDTAWLAAAVILVAAQSLIYPLAAMFITLVSLLYSATTPRKTKLLCKKIMVEKKYAIIYVVITAAIIIGITLQYESPEKLFETILNRIIFPQEEIPFDVTYSIIKLYGLNASIAAFIGVLVTGYYAARYHGRKQNRGQKILIYWLLLAYLGIFMYHKKDYTIILPYHRALYFGMLGMAPLSAIGAIWTVKTVWRVFRLPQLFFPILVVVVLSPVLWDSFNDYYVPPSDVGFYHVIEDADYEVLAWFGGEYGGGFNFLAPYWTSVAVYPVTLNHVPITIVAVYGGGSKDELDSFFNGDCDTKQKLTIYNNIDYVLSKKEFDCTFLENVYEKDKRFIYKVV